MTAILRRRLNKTDIGQMIETDNRKSGILIAPAFQHVNRYGERIGPKFDYFAAAHDTHVFDGLPEQDTHTGNMKRIANLRSVHGHDGTSSEHNIGFINEYGRTYRPIILDDEDKLLMLLGYDCRENSNPYYINLLGFWHPPTLSLLSGLEDGGTKINQNSLYDLRNTGRLKGTFNEEAHQWAMSHHRDLVYTHDQATNGYLRRKNFWRAHFKDGRSDFQNSGEEMGLSRPVRAELVCD